MKAIFKLLSLVQKKPDHRLLRNPIAMQRGAALLILYFQSLIYERADVFDMADS